MAERRNENMGQTGGANKMGTTGSTGTAGSSGGMNKGMGTTGGSTTGTTGGGQGNVGGSQEINRMLENVSFPVSKQDLINKVGNQQINLQGRQLPVRDVINRINKDRFQDRNEIVRELNNMPEFKGGMGGATGGGMGTGAGSRVGGGRQ